MASSKVVPFPVTVHPYASSKVKHACAYELGSPAKKALVFIGGLSDGPHTVPYIRTVAAKMEASADVDYSVFEIRIRSSFDGFGWGSLAEDVEDISAVVEYLRGMGKEKIVLMGHSTGCQDCMEYSRYDKHQNEPVDGFIMQASISDREAYIDVLTQATVDDMVALAQDMITSGRGDDVVPKSRLPLGFPFPNPLTAYRLHSLSAVDGDDDYFSSDLSDAKVKAIWGSIRKPVLIVPSEEDEYVPSHVDFAKLLARWKSHCPMASDLSALIPGAGHAVEPRPSQEWLADRVVRFLKSLDEQEQATHV